MSVCLLSLLVSGFFHKCVCVCVCPSSEVLKRLDDSSEEVRGVALRALGLWLASLGKDYNSQLYSQHLEVLFQQLLLHLDDPDSRVQDTVLGETPNTTLVQS